MCKAGYPKNGPDLVVSGRQIIKSILKIGKRKIKFLRAMCLRNIHFLKLEKISKYIWPRLVEKFAMCPKNPWNSMK